MCVICIKEPKVAMPSEETFRAMFEANADGAGFMFCRDHLVHIRKGFMDIDSFLAAVKKERLDRNLVIFHFRISTSGEISPEQTHPFPISDKLGDLRNTSLTTDLAIAHNGIISTSTSEDKKARLSDTMKFIQNYLAAPCIRDNIEDSTMFSLVELAVGSYNKIAFLTKANEYYLMGSWSKSTKEEYKDLVFSNLSWERKVISFFRSSGAETTRGVFTLSKRALKRWKRQCLSNGIAQGNDGVWRYSKEGSKEVVSFVDDGGDYVANNTVTCSTFAKYCPACHSEINFHMVSCTKCGVFLDRRYGGMPVCSTQ